VRTQRWIEAMELIRALWGGQWVDHYGAYYTVSAKLYDPPVGHIPLYVAASGTKSVAIAGRMGDAWITDAKSAVDPRKLASFREGAAGRDPQDVPIVVEQWMVVGGRREAEEAAAQWRMVPRGFTKYFYNPDPRAIEADAERTIPLENVYADWPVSDDADVHVEAIRKLAEHGVAQVFVHSGQKDQRRVIDFYATRVLPKLRTSPA
jgi:F420-dependent hydroxymycolic acid dehydrogenase